MQTAIRLEHDCHVSEESGCVACNEFDTYAQGPDEGADEIVSDRLVRNLEDGALMFVAVAAVMAFVWNAI